MTTRVSVVRNVNEALVTFISEAAQATPSQWRVISPRGLETIEHRGTWITEYLCPRERVLFSPARDANPFFHLMESLWILAGRQDVEFLSKFNSNIASFSDDGVTFHAPYGHRLRRHFTRVSFEQPGTQGAEPIPHYERVDQIAETITLLTAEADTRRAVMAIWDPVADCNMESKDIPCNDLIMFKIRDERLDMTVSCRSNDAVWGAFGANAVQFSMLQEFIAAACGVQVGVYVQISDSMHVYTDNPAWQRLLISNHLPQHDPYSSNAIVNFPLLNRGVDNWQDWLRCCEQFVANQRRLGPTCNFFTHVAAPVRDAWNAYKDNRPTTALEILLHDCAALDWRRACMEWIQRRV
jgi:thymidylate synthase